MKIYHVADKYNKEVSYLQELTDNTVVLLSDKAFKEICDKYFSHKDNIIYLNENEQEFIPSLSVVIDGYKRTIVNKNQNITFFVYPNDMDEYNIILLDFIESIKTLDDIWFVEDNPHKENNYEFVAFTEYKNYENLATPIVKLRIGILLGRFGFLYPESREVE